jgi:hypothetical protein
MDDPKQKLDETLKSVLKDNTLSPDNMVNITLTLMKTVEGFSALTGVQKKQLVLDTIKSYLATSSSDNNSTLMLLLTTTVPMLIDSFVAIDKKGLFTKARKQLCFFC